MSIKTRIDPLTGGVVPTYFHYLTTSLLGMVAATSAEVIDGLFVGNYLGSEALAAVGLVIPVYSLLFGVSLMIGIGGSVICGKQIGEGKNDEASQTFTKSFLFLIFFSILGGCLGVVFIDEVIRLLGATETIHHLVRRYLIIIFIFSPGMAGCFGLSIFVRVDGFPRLSLFALIACSLMNVMLNFLFLVVMRMGLTGAALATGIAETVTLLILLPHFYRSRGVLRLKRPTGSWRFLLPASVNGLSEFVNEISSGVVIFTLNWIYLRNLGTDGLAAFTIVSYAVFISLMLFYGIADGIMPLISTNFGARQSSRIGTFFKLAVSNTVVFGSAMVAAILLFPDALGKLFLREDGVVASEIAVSLFRICWPYFILSGLNIVLSAYFTSLQRATQSVIIATSRSLILPLGFIGVFVLAGNVTNSIAAVPLAEVCTLAIGLLLFKLYRYGKKEGESDPPQNDETAKAEGNGMGELTSTHTPQSSGN